MIESLHAVVAILAVLRSTRSENFAGFAEGKRSAVYVVVIVRHPWYPAGGVPGDNAWIHHSSTKQPVLGNSIYEAGTGGQPGTHVVILICDEQSKRAHRQNICNKEPERIRS